MNEFQHVACKMIFDVLMHRPISRIFWECKNGIENCLIEKPISLNLISQKLENHIYKSPIEFSNDVYTMLSNAKQWNSELSIKPAAADLLYSDFQKAYSIFNPADIPLSIKIRMNMNDLNQLIETSVSSTSDNLTSSDPISYVIHHRIENPDSIEIFDILKLLELLKSTEYMLKVLRYIYHIQPDAIIVENGITFLYENVQKQNFKEIYDYAMKQVTIFASSSKLRHNSFTGSLYNEIFISNKQNIQEQNKEVQQTNEYKAPKENQEKKTENPA